MARSRLPQVALLSLTLAVGGGVGVQPLWAQAQDTAPPAPPAPSAPATPPAPAPTPPAPAPPAPGAPPTDAAPAEPGAENASLELVRRSEKDGKERRIRIVRTGTSDETGIFTVCGPQDDEPETAPNIAVFSETGAGGIQITIDKNLIRVPLAVVTQQQPKEGQEGSDGRVEASAGTARFLDAAPEGARERLLRCGVEASPKPAPDTVFVTQGKTSLQGQKLLYDETDGIARIDGPITFKRPNETDPLSGTSQRIEVDVDAEKTTLVGNVVLNSEGGRVSRAARVEYDDTRNLARLIGTPEQPAESVKGGDKLTAGTILYDLDRNEVYAVKPEGGTITGEFQDGEAAEQPASAPSGPGQGTPGQPSQGQPAPGQPAPGTPAPGDGGTPGAPGPAPKPPPPADPPPP